MANSNTTINLAIAGKKNDLRSLVGLNYADVSNAWDDSQDRTEQWDTADGAALGYATTDAYVGVILSADSATIIDADLYHKGE